MYGVCAYVCMYVCYACAYVCMCVCVCVCVCVCMFMCVYVCACVCVCVCPMDARSITCQRFAATPQFGAFIAHLHTGGLDGDGVGWMVMVSVGICCLLFVVAACCCYCWSFFFFCRSIGLCSVCKHKLTHDRYSQTPSNQPAMLIFAC